MPRSTSTFVKNVTSVKSTVVGNHDDRKSEVGFNVRFSNDFENRSSATSSIPGSSASDYWTSNTTTTGASVSFAPTQTIGLGRIRKSLVAGMLMDAISASENKAWVNWQDLSSTTGVRLSRFWLTFEDDIYESLYAVVIIEQIRFSSLLAYVFLIVYCIHSLCGRALEGQTMDISVWKTSAQKAYNISWLSILVSSVVAILSQARRMASRRRTNTNSSPGRLTQQDMKLEPSVAVFLSVCIWVRCLFGEQTTVAALLGEDSERTFGIAECEGNSFVLLMHTCTGMLYLCLFTHMRFQWLLITGFSVVLAFAVATLLGADSGGSLLHPIGLALCQAALIILSFVGQRQIEMTRRRSFVWKVEAETQKAAFNKEKKFSNAKKQSIADLKSTRLALFKDVKKAYTRHRTKQFGMGKTPSCNFDLKASGESQRLGDEEGTWLDTVPVAPDEQEREVVYNCLDDYPELVGTALAEALPPDATTDWIALNRAVARMREPVYPLRDFHNDMLTAFPELGLYTYGADEYDDEHDQLSSGRSRLEELARTIGALYAVYWIMRLDLDGKLGFCFGYDDDWNIQSPCEGPSASELKELNFFKLSASERQLSFYHNFTWSECRKLFESAGLYKTDGKHQILEVCHIRLRALLVLTAIHDVMKNGVLCPTVQAEHGPFHEYKVGDVVTDHDCALDYVLAFYGNLFPSYRDLDEESQKVIRFTQGKMGFNNGWLVQGEAPPGALFSEFKSLISAGGAVSNDVAFYFAHWVTDLAGAEATPLKGAVKFVQRFPQFVMESFFRSFPYVWKLSDKSESEVYQEYLRARWSEDQKTDPVPTGENAVAIMRLALQVQTHPEEVIPAFDRMLPQDRQVLSEELARTGLVRQNYNDLMPISGYPAILVYYSPAFLQNNWEHLSQALTIMSDIFRLGRELLPLCYEKEEEVPGASHGSLHDFKRPSDASGRVSGIICTIGQATSQDVPDPDLEHHTASIRIEVLKDLKVQEIIGPRSAQTSKNIEGYFLVKKGTLEVVVEKHPMSALNTLITSGAQFRFLA